MNIPTLPAGRNKYYDLGPTRQFDIDSSAERCSSTRTQ